MIKYGDEDRGKRRATRDGGAGGRRREEKRKLDRQANGVAGWWSLGVVRAIRAILKRLRVAGLGAIAGSVSLGTS